MEHSGQSYFGIRLLDEDGEYVDLPVNGVGLFFGSKAAQNSGEGTYLLDISADGEWGEDSDDDHHPDEGVEDGVLQWPHGRLGCPGWDVAE